MFLVAAQFHLQNAPSRPQGAEHTRIWWLNGPNPLASELSINVRFGMGPRIEARTWRDPWPESKAIRFQAAPLAKPLPSIVSLAFWRIGF